MCYDLNAQTVSLYQPLKLFIVDVHWPKTSWKTVLTLGRQSCCKSAWWYKSSSRQNAADNDLLHITAADSQRPGKRGWGPVISAVWQIHVASLNLMQHAVSCQQCWTVRATDEQVRERYYITALAGASVVCQVGWRLKIQLKHDNAHILTHQGC